MGEVLYRKHNFCGISDVKNLNVCGNAAVKGEDFCGIAAVSGVNWVLECYCTGSKLVAGLLL